jgi:hypothetical protein
VRVAVFVIYPFNSTMKQFFLYSVSLFLVIAACSYEGFAMPRAAPEASQTLSELPISQITDESERYLLYEGETDHQGFLVPDGNIWLYDKLEKTVTLLTHESNFGESFFASDARLLVGENKVLITVNYTNNPYNLYLIDLATNQPEWLTSAQQLSLEEIDTHSLQVRGNQIRFWGRQLLDASRPQLGLRILDVSLEVTNGEVKVQVARENAYDATR